MSNFSRIVLMIIILLSFFFIKEKTGFEFNGISSLFNKFQKETAPAAENKEIVKPPSEILKDEEAAPEMINIYFLALDSDGSSIYKKVLREAPKSESKIAYAAAELLKGPSLIEKAQGAYTEIPQDTKIISIKETENKIIINLSSDFQFGGGTDSIYSRMMQLIKTAAANSGGKKTYLYLDGKQVKFIGGEGIMVSQPLNEKSLEI